MKMRSSLILGCVILALVWQPSAEAQTPPVINSFTLEDPRVFVGGRATFGFDVTGADDLQIDQGVGAVTGGSARFSQTEKVYIIPRGATWSYLADGSDQGASDIVSGNGAYGAGNWKHPMYDDASWLSGPAQLGYGDNNLATEVGFIDVDPEAEGDQKNATTYYRQRFSITASEIAGLENLYMEMRRDDGAIVYLNGVEVSRMNVGDGVLNFDTYTEGLGHSSTGGGAETTYFVCELAPSMLQAGENTLAVEIHQFADTSSDTRFDLGLFQQVTVAGQAIFASGGNWRFLDNGSDLGDAAIVAGAPGFDNGNWKHPEFDDGSWPDGEGDFGYDAAVINETTVLRFGPNEDNAANDPDNKFLTSYFRNTFELTAEELSLIATAAANMRVDDGAILYINGFEIARDGMPAGEITSDSEAAATGVSETNYDPFPINPFRLVAGTNTVAVEVHQSSARSSDVSFDMEVTVSDAFALTLTKLARGSAWQYLDDGGASLGNSSSNIVAGTAAYNDQNWKHPSFDDSSWRSGAGELGYGDTPLTTGGNLRQSFNTELSFGPDPQDKFVTTYFRRKFDTGAAAIGAALGARISAKIDDGAIVFLNGIEIWRNNLPPNPDPEDPEPGEPVDGSTLAIASAGSDGRTATTVEFDKNLLVDGTNTIAVELHQSSLTSSDAVFDLGMEFVVRSTPVVAYTLTASNQFGASTATLNAETVAVPDSPIYLTNSNASNVSWIFPEVWSDKQAPHGGQYVAYGQFDSVIRTPLGEDDPIFAGDSLALSGGSTQLVLYHLSGTASINTVNLVGGRIVNGVSRDLAVGGVGNSIVVLSDSTIGSNGAGSMTVSANLTGSAQVRVRNPGGEEPGTTIFTGDNSAFTGGWLIQGPFSPASPTALGSGAITVVDGGVLDPGIDYLSPLPNPLALSVEAVLNLDQTLAFDTGGVSIDGNVVPDGIYNAIDLEALGFGGIFIDGGSQLFVGAVDLDSDGDGLLDAWELSFFDDLDATDGSGDADGDGQSDGAEFAASTSPIDPEDVLKITSTTQLPSGEVTFTWPSSLGVSYGVRFGDLSSWTVIATGLAGTGGEMSFTDDGSLSGSLPSAAEERHYQVFVE